MNWARMEIWTRKTKKAKVALRNERVTTWRALSRAAVSFPLANHLLRLLRRKSASAVAVTALALMLASAPLLLAFEAHIINVTASLVQIDPPVITPSGGAYDNPLEVIIDDADPDATYIFWTVTPGTDPSLAPDPACGGPAGGPKPQGPIEIPDDRVVKAIACDGADGSAHHSTITTEIYDLTLTGRIEGRKYHDLDSSGTLTTGDIGIEGWKITLTHLVTVGSTTASEIVGTTVTDSTGYYAFPNLDPDDYDVSEEDRAGWTHVTSSVVPVSLVTGETEVVNFFNYDTGFSCVPTPISFPTNLAVQVVGTDANDDVTVSSNVIINGSVRSNDEIEAIGGGTNRTINGDASATNAISTGNFTITGTVATGTPVVSLPDIGIATWKSRAQEGGTVNGSFVFPNNTVGLVMGPTEIMGDLTFGSSNSVLIRGPMYVHGNLSIGSNTTINQDAAFGNQFTTIIVDGTVDINSNITFNGAGTTGAFLLVSTRAAVSGSGAAILTNSNNSDLGDVVLYASNGDIHIDSNRTLLALFATHGTGTDGDDNGAIRLDSNVTVNYRPLPTSISCGPRQPHESTSHVLVNEFMPNPSGSDQGSVGLPHDGEWVELFNPTAATIDVAGFVLYDNNNTHALAITNLNTNTGGTLIPSEGYLVVYRDGDTDFELNNSGGDSVRLFSGLITSGGVLIDSHTYVRDAPENKSFARVPDGSSNWVDPDATPGEPNVMPFVVPENPDAPIFEPADKPMLYIQPIPTNVALTEEIYSESVSQSVDVFANEISDENSATTTEKVAVDGSVLGVSTTTATASPEVFDADTASSTATTSTPTDILPPAEQTSTTPETANTEPEPTLSSERVPDNTSQTQPPADAPSEPAPTEPAPEQPADQTQTEPQP